MILNSFFILLGLGLLASLMLAIASKIFYVWEDPRIEQVEDALLGANCGGCGYAGCASAAQAVVKGEAKLDVCSAGGFEIAQGVAAVLGQAIEEKEPEISKPGCTYGFQDAELIFNYNGVIDCRAAMLLYEGSKECTIGCLGLSTCVQACPFDALSMGDDNLPVVNKNKCVACGICVEVCPKNIITLTSSTKRILADTKLDECTAPCQRHCPSEIDIPEYIRQISQGNYLEAVKVIKEKNPFPLICGWICPAPCEYQCRRNLIDEPVTINALKKFVSDYEMESGQIEQPYMPPPSGNQIAVIGGGVEGLTASYYLRRLGQAPTIYEATDKLGGILRHVITEDRLPRKVLDWEIKGILDTGIEALTEKTIGKDFTMGSLFKNGSDMVLVTAGGWDSRQIMRGIIEIETMIPATYLLLDLMIAAKKGKEIKLGNKVVILGGGQASVHAAHKCLEMGAKEVVVVYPSTKAESNHIEWTESSNISYHFSALPSGLKGEGDRLTDLTLSSCLNGVIEEENIKLDNLIVGSGRFPEMLFVKEEANQWKTIDILKIFPAESNTGIFSIGDIGRTSDLSRVVLAIGRGRKIARSIYLYANNEEIKPEDAIIVDEQALQNIYEINNSGNLKAERGNVDSIMTLTENETIGQAERCLNCGLICYKKELNQEKIDKIPL